jgi:hypothetical protein
VATSEPVVTTTGEREDGAGDDEVRPSVFNGLLGGRLASRPVFWSLLEMGDSDDLDFVRCDLAIGERVGEASNQNSACPVECSPTLRALQDVEDLVADRRKEL